MMMLMLNPTPHAAAAGKYFTAREVRRDVTEVWRRTLENDGATSGEENFDDDWDDDDDDGDDGDDDD